MSSNLCSRKLLQSMFIFALIFISILSAQTPPGARKEIFVTTPNLRVYVNFVFVGISPIGVEVEKDDFVSLWQSSWQGDYWLHYLHTNKKSLTWKRVKGVYYVNGASYGIKALRAREFFTTGVYQDRVVFVELDTHINAALIDKTIETFSKIKALKIKYCREEDLKLLQKFPNLVGLSLHRADISDNVNNGLGLLTNLKALDLSDTKIGDVGIRQLKNLSELRALNLKGTNVMDEGLKHLEGLQNLRSLNLRWTKISNKGLEYVKNLSQLQNLDLWGTRISDEGLVHLESLSNLRILNLWGVQIGNKALLSIQKLVNLRRLNLSWTRITDGGLKHIKTLKNLRELQLAGTNITDKSFEHLKEMIYLYKLDLTGTRISKSLVKELKKSLPYCKILR